MSAQSTVHLKSTLLIAIGGGIGSVSRFWASFVVTRFFGDALPWGTIIVNITGAFIIGLFSTITGEGGRTPASHMMREFFMVGVCGGYTTFSAFSLQTLNLANNGQALRAGANVVISVVMCLLAVWLGHLLAVQLNSSKGA
jgi:fluoride exporter